MIFDIQFYISCLNNFEESQLFYNTLHYISIFFAYESILFQNNMHVLHLELHDVENLWQN